MKYVVELNGQRREVGLEGDRVTLDGKACTARLEGIDGTPLVLVTIENRIHRIAVRRGAGRGAYTMNVDGYRFDVEALDERTRAIRDLSAPSSRAAGPAALIAPMPGLIVRVNVQPGDEVQSGQGLVVIEAMKMENELRSPAPGRVKSVAVAAGTAVEKGTLLVELEPLAVGP